MAGAGLEPCFNHLPENRCAGSCGMFRKADFTHENQEQYP